jgi:hypothetical protein
MAIFNVQGKRLKPVNEIKFDLEKAIQKLTEENLETLFGLKFVSGLSNKEFSVRAQEQDFYIDTLAFDEQQRAFVIIEYKKDRTFSVIDQGFSYLSAMLNNKAEFILELNRKLDKNYGKDDVDWELSRLIFISPEFTNYQKNAINFKDLPFSLYEVKAYEQGIIEFNPIKPFRASASIQAYTKDKIVKDVTKQVKVFNVEDHFHGSKSGMWPLYEYLRNGILALDTRFKENPRAPYIGFPLGNGSTNTVMYLHVYTNKLRADFPRIRPDDIGKNTGLRFKKGSVEHWNTPTSELFITSEKDADMAILISKQILNRFFK